MRIGLVVTGGVDRSGRERVIPALLWLIEHLARSHELFVYVLQYHRQPCTYPLLGATIRDLGSPAGIRRQTAALTQTLRADGPFNVLHAYWAMPAGLAAGLAGRRLGVPVIVTCDSGEFVSVPDADYGLQRRLRHRLAVAAAVRLAHAVTVCTGYQQHLARACGVSAEVIPIGVDTRVFARGTTRNGPPWRLVHVANLNPVKDQVTLLHAFKRILIARPDVGLDVAGLDTMNGVVQRLAASLGIAEAVAFLGFQPTDQLSSTYHRAHLAVLSSRHEAAGVATLEAAACGVPTVGTDVGYVHDWSPDRAIAVAPRDATALADAVLTLLEDRDQRQAIAQAARAWTLAHDADWTAHAFTELYARVASGGRQ
jgi:glycosyltransferase involved in cell wall biosynthesis